MTNPITPTLDEQIEIWRALPSDRQVTAFRALGPADAAECFLRLQDDERNQLVLSLHGSEQRIWLRMLAPDDAADLIQEVAESDRQRLIEQLDQRSRAYVEALLAYQADVAGGRMDPRYARVPPEMMVEHAFAYMRLQAAGEIPMIYYAYVIDDDGRLLGVVSFRDLILAAPQRRIREVMLIDVAAVRDDTDQEEIVALLQSRGLLAVPVVDAAGRMRGIVTVDDVIDVVREEATEDIQKLGGLEALDLPYFRTGPISMLRKRAGWLSILFVGEMLTATAMGFFEHEIERAVVLALFVPLIISSGGNSGSQASTLVIRAMALGEVRLGDWWRVMRREIGFGFALGVILATLGAARIFGFETLFGSYGERWVPVMFTVAVSVVGVVTWGTISGATLPFVLRRLGFDPATASAPFVATMVDVTGLVIYFTAAKFILLGGI